MQLEKGKISLGQLFFLVVSFNLSASLLATPANEAGHDAWLAIIAGLGEGLIFVYIFSKLASLFPQKTLIEFNDLIYGPLLGKFISLTYLGYFFLIMTLELRLFGDFFSGLIFPKTPIMIIIGMLLIICGSAVRNGIEVIARCSQILLPFVILAVIFTTILSLKDFEINKLLPVMDLPMREFLITSHYTATFPFGETIFFLMIMAFLDKKSSSAPLVMMLAISSSALLLTITAIRNTGLLGNTSVISAYSSYQATRLIQAGEVFTRLEILVAINFLSMGFIGISLGLYTITMGFSQVLGLKTYLPLVTPIAILLLVISITQFDSYMEYTRFSSQISPYLALPFQLVIPLISLLMVKIRKLPKGDTNSKK